MLNAKYFKKSRMSVEELYTTNKSFPFGPLKKWSIEGQLCLKELKPKFQKKIIKFINRPFLKMFGINHVSTPVLTSELVIPSRHMHCSQKKSYIPYVKVHRIFFLRRVPVPRGLIVHQQRPSAVKYWIQHVINCV